MISDFPGPDCKITMTSITEKSFIFLLYDVSNKQSFSDLEDYIENINFNNKN